MKFGFCLGRLKIQNYPGRLKFHLGDIETGALASSFILHLDTLVIQLPLQQEKDLLGASVHLSFSQLAWMTVVFMMCLGSTSSSGCMSIYLWILYWHPDVF